MKIGRNKPCPCGSGKKYKRCCMPKEEVGRMTEKISEPKNQHFVPRTYLSEFTDPDGFLWICSKDGKTKRKQKPEKTFRSNHLYTIEVKGVKNYKIEESLANIEGQYAKIFKDKIKNKLPLSDYEHIILCVFVAAQFQRTLRFKRNQENFIQQIIEHGQQISMAHNANFRDKERWESYKKDIHKLRLVEGLPFLSEMLSQMSLAFLCSANPVKHPFITSDDPCTLFNPDLQWQKFYGPGLGQEHVQLTLPLSAEITVMFCWANYSGYSKLNPGRVEDMNRMTRGHCDKEFVHSKDKTKLLWFSPVPLDFFFLFRIIKNELKFWFMKLKSAWKYRKHRRK